jgi:hypothetical protein
VVDRSGYRGTIDIVDGRRSSRHFSSAFSNEFLWVYIIFPLLINIPTQEILCAYIILFPLLITNVSMYAPK